MRKRQKKSSLAPLIGLRSPSRKMPCVTRSLLAIVPKVSATKWSHLQALRRKQSMLRGKNSATLKS